MDLHMPICDGFEVSKINFSNLYLLMNLIFNNKILLFFIFIKKLIKKKKKKIYNLTFTVKINKKIFCLKFFFLYIFFSNILIRNRLLNKLDKLKNQKVGKKLKSLVYLQVIQLNFLKIFIKCK